MSDEDKPDTEQSGTPVRRRLLLAAGVVGVGAAGVAGYEMYRRARTIPPPTTQLERGYYRRLGRTGLKVSAVGIGAGGVDRPELISRAVDSGVNYIDTSICYGDSELVIGRALKQRKDLRDKLIIATKWDAAERSDKASILASLDKSLKRLGVERIDIVQLHWLGGGHIRPDDGFNRLDNAELYLAMEEAKRSGKVRFFGATSHAATRAAILGHAIDKKAFDMLLVKMNLLDYQDAGLPKLLAKARQHDVGVVVMKSQPSGGAMPPGFAGSKWSVYQANLRWVLSHDVACVVHSGIGTDEQVQDAAIEAARESLSEREQRLLERYARAMSPHYCRGCGEICQSSCPASVAIPEVLQFRMYDEHYGWHARAAKHYRSLSAAEQFDERCLRCDACTEACPYGVNAAEQVRDARRRFAWLS